MNQNQNSHPKDTDSDDSPVHANTTLLLHLLRQAALRMERRPLAGAPLRLLRRAEDWSLLELKHRLDRAGRSPPDPLGASRVAGVGVHPSEILAELLEASQGTDQDGLEQDFYVRVLRQLCPSQARILALMADGEPWPMVHVASGPLLGSARHSVVSFASSVGKEAGVLLRGQVPYFVSHLQSLGLIVVGPEDTDMRPLYEILEADPTVRDALAYAEEELGQHPSIQRHTIYLSDFGRALWHVAQPEDDAAPAAIGRSSDR